MYKARDIYNAIDNFAPFSSALPWDNSGLLIGSFDAPADKIVFALDVTDKVIDRALEIGAKLIVTHHPVIFSAQKNFLSDSIAYRAACAGLSVICAHTNLDMAPDGTSDIFARTLALARTTPLSVEYSVPYNTVSVFVPDEHVEKVYSAMAAAGAGYHGHYSGCGFLSKGEGRFVPLEGASPFIGNIGERQNVAETRLEMIASPADTPRVLEAMLSAHPYEKPAYGIYENQAIQRKYSIGYVGKLSEPIDFYLFADIVGELFGVTLRISYTADDFMVDTVAICPGSGGEYLKDAVRAGAQVLITGDIKYSTFVEAKHLGIGLIDAGHYNTEFCTLKVLAEKLEKLYPGISTVYVEDLPFDFI